MLLQENRRKNMLLRKYLEKNQITIKEFAESLDITRAYLRRVACGLEKPGTTLTKLIELKTNGLVTAKDFEKDQSFFDIYRG